MDASLLRRVRSQAPFWRLHISAGVAAGGPDERYGGIDDGPRT